MSSYPWRGAPAPKRKLDTIPMTTKMFLFQICQISQLKPPVQLCNIVGQLSPARCSEVASETEEAGVGKNDCEDESTDCSSNVQASVLICWIFKARSDDKGEAAGADKGKEHGEKEAGVWGFGVEGSLVKDLVEVGQDLLSLREGEKMLNVVIEAGRGVEHRLEWERYHWEQHL